MKTRFKELLRKSLRAPCGERGMTLVETLVAIAILGVIVTTFVPALSAGAISVSAQAEDARVQGLARSQMEMIKAADYDPGGFSYPGIDTPAGYAVNVIADSSLYGSGNIQKITVNVSREGSLIYSLEGYKANR
ncbi:MAG: type II secretion system protein [Dehalococcoidales bacterium]|nr:type II secretion system protein [Dehalococcoidales bacterium]